MNFDAIVIGAGQAGPSLAVRLANSGRRTAIVERKLLGGTCVNVGCIPTKTLIASARVAHFARIAGEHGVDVQDVRVDMARVKARKDDVVRQSSDGLEKWLGETPNLTLVRGHARFEAPTRVRVNDEVLEAPQIFLDVGARSAARGIEGLDAVKHFDNSGMMGVDFLPEHLVIVGGSYIGLEFAQMYRRFGSRVTVVEMGPRLIGREDEDVSREVQAMLEREGIEFKLASKCLEVSREGEGVRVRNDCEGRREDAIGSHLLIATGRTPNTDDLGLEQAGVAKDERGFITVDDELRTSVPGIWALGEANGRGAFTHTSYNDYEIVAANLLDGDKRRVSDRIPIYALFVDPPLGRVGMSEAEVRKSGRKALIGRMPMTRVGRARERGETQGFMKVLVDAGSKQFLGAALLGIEGDEVVHTIADLMYARAPYTVMQRAVHVHPTVSELLPTLLGSLEPLT
ncbi:MAG TPA: FAD-containing oxidoreductase [Burkholderiales bacterium]|nr:FAD-containing oxidoreductase [Burkholderiales bacterium]